MYTCSSFAASGVDFARAKNNMIWYCGTFSLESPSVKNTTKVKIQKRNTTGSAIIKSTTHENIEMTHNLKTHKVPIPLANVSYSTRQKTPILNTTNLNQMGKLHSNACERQNRRKKTRGQQRHTDNGSLGWASQQQRKLNKHNSYLVPASPKLDSSLARCLRRNMFHDQQRYS